jgi:anti-sigma B factor antagonist
MLDIDDRENATIIHVLDDIDLASAGQLESALPKTRSEKPVIVSLAGCSYCDSSGLTVLVRAKKRLDGNFAIVVPNDGSCNRTFEVTALDRVLPIYRSLEAALDSFARQAS